MIDHKQNRENIIRDLKLNLIGPSPTGKPIKIDEMLIFDSYDEMYLPYRQFNSEFPKNSGDEILNNQKPSERYGLGILYPIKPRKLKNDDEENETLNNPEIERSTFQTNKKLNKRKNDLVDDIENLKNDLNIEVEKDLLPSSFSLSFLIDPSLIDNLKFEFTGGFYEKTNNEILYKNKGEQKKGREWFFRSALKCSGLISLNEKDDDLVKTDLPLPKHFKLEFKRLIRNKDNNKIITFSVSNITGYYTADRRDLDRNSIFQSQLRIFSDKYCILPYPKPKNLILNDEEQVNDLLYRDKKNYAIGHGISANWGLPDKLTNCVKEISSQAMPIVDVPNISPDIFDNENKKIEISFFNLSRFGNFDDGIKSLKDLNENYTYWIEKIKNESIKLEQKYNNPSKVIIENCEKASERIKRGIDLINENDQIKLAFQIANEAIMFQQYRTSIKDRFIKFSETGEPIKDNQDYFTFSSPFDANFDLNTSNYKEKKWRPFQIAFILMNLESLANQHSEDRKIVDLLWFPTGGGKTEAYLGLSAFQMVLRRLRNKADFGTDVIMRYTLRLLTAQQFHRASGLIYALEHIRKKNIDILGEHKFSIGIWIGGDSTYNQKKQAYDDFKKIIFPRGKNEINLNKFHISGCSWCGAKFEVKRNKTTQHIYGLKKNDQKKEVYAYCPDQRCEFHEELPTYTCDEDLYEKKPSFLIATIDKFALLAWRPEARNFFGIDEEGNKVRSAPNLIIQDELHLISGPLGSMTGLYETVVEELCSNNLENKIIKPKIISSTATIKNFNHQIRSLFGRDKTSLFPPPGLNQSDNFFSRVALINGKVDSKKYLGIYAPGLRSLLTSQIRTFTSLLQSANYDRVLDRELSSEEKDPWWTLVSFYSSLFDLGSARSILGIDMDMELKNYQKTFGIDSKYIRKLPDPTEILELTAAQKDSVEENLQKLSLSKDENLNNKKAVDICLSSSVIEVGVDISRISLLSIVSAPKSVSQYIQVSGRVGRDWNKGKSALVVTIYSPTKPRDRSLYEQFRSFHEQLYSWVEPTTVTPFCEPVLERSLHSALFAFIRQKTSLINANEKANYKDYEKLCDEFKNLLLKRVEIIDKQFLKVAEKHLEKKINLWKNNNFDSWMPRKKDNEVPLLIPQGNYLTEKLKFNTFQTMTSMRNVDAECMPHIFSNYED